MRYGERTIWDKRLPAFTGIFVLLFALGLTVLLSRNAVQTVTKATVDSQPKDVRISNISPTSFTVSFTTDATALATLAYGKNSGLGQVAIDLRDQQGGQPKEHHVHYFTVQNLEPDTHYFFTITSGAQVATIDGKPYEVATAPSISTPPPKQNTISGTVAMDDGSSPQEGIVYASTETSQLVSGYLQQDGTYTIPLQQLRSKDLSTYLPLVDTTKISLEASNGQQSTKAVVLNSQASDVPQIVLSKDYNFAMSNESTSTQSGQTATQSGSFPVFDEPTAVTSPDIKVPKEGQVFKDNQPVFSGVALPTTPIQITIEADKEISANLQSDSKGYWEFKSPIVLSPGDHTITIASADVNGDVQKITRNFTINASGSQFTEPSVSPVEASPTQAPPVTPTLPELPSPTASATPTLEPTLVPTMDPSLLASVSPTRGPLGATGSYATVAGIVTSILFLGGGVILFFLIAV